MKSSSQFDQPISFHSTLPALVNSRIKETGNLCGAQSSPVGSRRFPPAAPHGELFLASVRWIRIGSSWFLYRELTSTGYLLRIAPLLAPQFSSSSFLSLALSLIPRNCSYFNSFSNRLIVVPEVPITSPGKQRVAAALYFELILSVERRQDYGLTTYSVNIQNLLVVKGKHSARTNFETCLIVRRLRSEVWTFQRLSAITPCNHFVAR